MAGLTLTRLKNYWVLQMNKIILSADAVADLQEIKKYISEELCNEAAALSTLAKITKSIRQLELFAECGKSLSETIGIDTDFRYLVCGNYLVFYTASENQIHVTRVLYARRNYLQILFGE